MRTIIDSSENRPDSKLPALPGQEISPNLEELTGADIMLTPSPLPVNSFGLIELHIKEGAILIQRKSGHDLVASMGQHINNSLARILATGAQPWQSVLLFHANFSLALTGNAEINQSDTGKDYWQVHAVLTKWSDRGGTYEIIPDGDVPVLQWFAMKKLHFSQYAESPVKQVWKEKPYFPKQFLEPVMDGRNLLAMLPGIGAKMAQLLWDEFNGNAAHALCWLTWMDGSTKITGIGDMTKQNVRQYLGLESHDELSIEIPAELLKPIASIVIASEFDIDRLKEQMDTFSNHRITGITIPAGKGTKPLRELLATYGKVTGISIDWDSIDHEDAAVKKNKLGQEYNAAAPYLRNTTMLENATHVLAPANSSNKQIEDIIAKAEKNGIIVISY